MGSGFSSRYLACLLLWSLFLLPRVGMAQGQGAELRLFSYNEERKEGFGIFPQWVSVMRRQQADLATPENCPVNLCRVPEWQQLIASLKGRNIREQLVAVNEFANRFRYVLDQDNYGRSDYWAIPREFLTLGGDCEDFAIIKYFSLRQLGVSVDALRIVVVQDANLRIPHAILAAYMPEGILVLDNQIREVILHTKISHYVPVFSLNERHWWMHLP